MGRKYNRVGVLKGGISSEREVSLKSGSAIARGLRDGGYDVKEIDVTAHDFTMPADLEAVFIALHGAFGEDGELQQQLIDQSVPFTGSGAASCRISFDKVLTRKRLMEHGIPVARGEVLQDASKRTLPVPLVAKPPREGSSVGCYLVFDEEEWNDAFEGVRKYSNDVLVEAYIAGRELTVGIVDGQVLPVVEIAPAAGWYDFKSKYVSQDTVYTVPAMLDESQARVLRELALDTFNCLGAENFGRVDFRLSPSGEPYVLELNAIPGFTASSLLPKAAASAGIGFSELCCSIMELAHL